MLVALTRLEMGSVTGEFRTTYGLAETANARSKVDKREAGNIVGFEGVEEEEENWLVLVA